MLKTGQKVICEFSKEQLTVKKKLGEGGQGIVYLVEGRMGEKALKWYNTEQSTDEQKRSIRELVIKGAPKGKAGKRFVWPIDLVTMSTTSNFGYLMDVIDIKDFAELGEVWAHLKPVPNMHARCRISYELANSYRHLHLEGFCYRDISSGNLMFNPVTGEALICDNDNIGVNNQSNCQVFGTMEYMAPEIIMGKARPSTLTDLYSLAVLLFQFWIWHHPMHGEEEYNIRSWDLPAKKKVYGESPVFIFDPTNARNRLPKDPEYDTPRRFWKHCPEPLKKLFIRSFTEGLHNPNRRVTEGEWQDAFLELQDCIVSCPNDRAENFWYEDLNKVSCWYCKKDIDSPVVLELLTSCGKRNVVITKNTKVLLRHVDPYAEEEIGISVIGEMIQNPNNPSLWGLKNVTQNQWKISLADGTLREVPPQKAAPLVIGTTIDFRNGTMGQFKK